jgi:hypothetical protein
VRSHGRSPAFLAGAISVVTAALVALGVSFAAGGQAQVAPQVEVSNSCAVVKTTTTLTIWGSNIPSGTHTISSTHGWFPDTAVTSDGLGNVVATVSYVPSDTVPDEVKLDGVAGPAIQVVAAGGCPTSTPPVEPCFATNVAVPVSVSNILPGTDTGAAAWFLDYPGAGLKPASFAPSTVANGSTASALPGGRASPGVHQITVIVQPDAVEGVVPPVYWTYPITFCTAPPDTSGPTPRSTTTTTRTKAPATTTTTTIRRATTTTAPHTTTTPATVPGNPVLSINPQVASTGAVIQVHGVGFPPNSAIILEWEPGIGVATAHVGADGTFTTPFLVMSRDQTGIRLVHASGFPPAASASLLVQPGPSEPASAGGQFMFRQG